MGFVVFDFRSSRLPVTRFFYRAHTQAVGQLKDRTGSSPSRSLSCHSTHWSYFCPELGTGGFDAGDPQLPLVGVAGFGAACFETAGLAAGTGFFAPCGFLACSAILKLLNILDAFL